VSEGEWPKTDLLRIPVISQNPGWIGGAWYLPNSSGGYHGLLKTWWEYFGLKGAGLLIGEEGESGKQVKKAFEETYNVKAYSVGLSNADILWDITREFHEKREYDWIICQATLEHVTDPVAAIKNLATVLKSGGRIYLHTAGIEFPIHRYPLDCYRFLPDGLRAMAQLAHLDIDDLYWTTLHCFAVYRKR